MRILSMAAGAFALLMLASCGGGSDGLTPNEQDIGNALEDQLRSVAGAWTGLSTGANAVSLEFTLQEGSGGQVSGSGSMKEANAASAVPFTVTGTFQRPTLTLNFSGMVYESRPVTGALQGSYTTVGGMSTTLKLTASDYSRDIAILLQEK